MEILRKLCKISLPQKHGGRKCPFLKPFQSLLSAALAGIFPQPQWQNGNQAAGGSWQISSGIILRPLALPSRHLCKKACSHCSLMTWNRSAKVPWEIRFNFGCAKFQLPSFSCILYLSLPWQPWLTLHTPRFGAEKCHASLPWCPPHNRRSPYIPSKSWRRRRRFPAMERCKVDLRGN